VTDTPIHNALTQQPAIEATPPLVATLTAIDRCDACASGAERAYVRVIFSDATELLFCAHHFAEHEAAILFHAPDEIIDERWQLEASEDSRLGDVEGTDRSTQCMMGDHKHCDDPKACACSCHGGRR